MKLKWKFCSKIIIGKTIKSMPGLFCVKKKLVPALQRRDAPIRIQSTIFLSQKLTHKALKVFSQQLLFMNLLFLDQFNKTADRKVTRSMFWQNLVKINYNHSSRSEQIK